MLQYKNVYIIGTSHIAKSSIEEIKTAFQHLNPEIIAVELDYNRLQGLLSEQKPNRSISNIKHFGVKGYLFALIGSYLQEKLGNVVGIKPGSDMLAAVKLAKKNSLQLELIDQDIEITLKRFSKKFSWKERFRLFFDILRAPFSKKVKINLNEVPEDELVRSMLGEIKKRYPNLYNVLIKERNEHMAKNIYKLMDSNPKKKILVVIGKGHEEDLLKLVKKEDFKRDRVY